MFIIDGGLSKAYQRTTGIAGYTLRYSSYGLTLVAHEPFTSRENAIINETDLHSERQIVEKVERKLIKDTDKGKELKDQIADLEKLLDAYKNGSISEKYIWKFGQFGTGSLFSLVVNLVPVLFLAIAKNRIGTFFN